MEKNKKRIVRGAVIAVLFILTLTICGFAAGYTIYEVKENTFTTGKIDIDLNGGEAVITKDEYLFEPGMTVEKNFYIQNNSTFSVYYRLFFENVAGELADILEITVKDQKTGDTILSGKMTEFDSVLNAAVAPDTLEVDEKRWYTIYFYFPPAAGNQWQADDLEFALSAQAVQTKNNDNKLFE